MCVIIEFRLSSPEVLKIIKPGKNEIMQKTTTTTVVAKTGKSKKNNMPNAALKNEVKKLEKKLTKIELRKNGNKGKQGKGKRPKVPLTKEQIMVRNEVTTIMKGITEPSFPVNLRVSSLEGETARTAAASPKYEKDVNFCNLSTDPNTQNYAAAFAFRSNLRAFVVATTQKGESNYRATQTMDLGFNEPTFFSEPLNFNSTTSTGPPLHGDWLYPGRDGNQDQFRGYWCDAPKLNTAVPITSIVTSLGVGLPATGVSVDILKWEFRKWKTMASLLATPAAPVLSYQVTEAGYYGVTYKIPTAGTTAEVVIDLGVQNNDTSAKETFYAHFATAGLDEQIASIQAMRVISSSIRFQQNASALSDGGSFHQYQAKSNTLWLDNSSTDQLSRYQQLTTNRAKDGVYSYLKPSTTLDFNWLNEWDVLSDEGDDENSQFDDGAFDILPPTGYLCVVGTLPAQTGTTALAGIWELWQKVEFQTSNQLATLDMPRFGQEAYKAALNCLVACPQHYTNDFHWEDIGKWIKETATTAGNLLVKYGPIVAETLLMVAAVL